jgi:hypothetical protein
MKFWIVIALAAAAQGAWAQSKLPPCKGHYAANKWTNCYGTNMTPTGAIYAGEWLDDKFDGQGTYSFRDGKKYTGQFRNNKRNGEGTFTWPDGARYVGGYKDDIRNGRGTFTYPNGTKFVGEYRDDLRNGPGTEYGADGRVLRSGIWENDELKKTSR